MKLRHFRIAGQLYREVVAQEPEQDVSPEDILPKAEQATEQLEQEPAAKWRDYLYPIILALQQQLGLDHDAVTLVTPKMVTDFGSPEYGFQVVGHLKADPADTLAPFGKPPYRFSARVDSEGTLMSPIEIEGAAP